MGDIAEPQQLGAAETRSAEPAAASGFASYLLVHGAWFLTNGMQGVLFPYLVRIILKGTAGQLGIAQMCLTLPSTFLVLIGGIIADRVDVRRQIMRLYSFTTLPFLGLAALLIAHALSYPLMILYAVSVGSIAAFTLPSRDALLARMAPDTGTGGIQRAVSFASLAQFAGQILGMTLASSAQLFGVLPLFFLQAGVMGGGAALARRLRPRPAPPKRHRGSQHIVAFATHEFMAGVRAVMRSRVIGPLTAISFGVASALPGSMQVLMPLAVQTYFPANLSPDQQPRYVTALAIFTLCFWIGTILTAAGLVRIGMPRHKGRAYLVAVALGGALLLIESQRMPFAGFCALNVLWGVANGVIITIGRGIVQELADEHLRARILSVFSFAFMVGGPVGALALGFLAGSVGPHHAMLLPGAFAILISLVGAALTPLWRIGPDARIMELPSASS